MTFALTAKQTEALKLLGGASTHTLLVGGSRSGKTFIICRSTASRAQVACSRHAMLRFRFNHIKTSIILDTWPKMMDLCYPGVAKHCRLDRTDWFYEMPCADSGTFTKGIGGKTKASEVWFGGLDDKDRTDKILGQEYVTMDFNEITQISYAARNTAITRLAQKVILPDGRQMRLRAWYDENPPSVAHWSYRMFIEKMNPDDRRPLPNPENYEALSMNPGDNLANLPPEYLAELGSLPERQRRRFLLGQFQALDENALWTFELLDRCRNEVREGDETRGGLPDMVRIVVAVDPSGVKGEEDERSDEVGIVVVGLGVDGIAYVLEDLSGRWSSEKWTKIAIDAFNRWEADRIVAEVNYGGGLVQLGIQAAGARVPFHEVRASRGKVVRAEPIAVLFERGLVRLNGKFPHLEDQLCAFTTAGYVGSRSPDRADAMVWGLADLFPQAVKGPRKDASERQSSANVGYGGAKARGRR